MFIVPFSGPDLRSQALLERSATKGFTKPLNGVPDWMTSEGLYMLQSGYLLPKETPWDAYVRLATASARALKKPELANKFFEILWKGWLGPASPVISNLGTDRGLPISCYSIEVEDSLEGIYDSVAELGHLSSKGGGVGIYMGNIRESGRDIAKGGKSSGVIPWSKIIDSATIATSQAGVRRGASSEYLPFSHGDIKAFINMRRPTGDENLRCMNIHHAVCLTDDDMREIEKGGQALELFKEILRARIETGEPYLFFTDNVNRVLPKGYEALGLKVKTSNICTEITGHTDTKHTFVCCLSSMNLTKWNEWRETKAVYYATMFLDGVMQEYINKTKGLKHFENARRFAVKSRMLGIGAMGWHSLLQENKLSFNSFGASLLNRAIFNHMAEESNKASKDLAKEFGEPEWCKGTGTRNTHTCVTGDTKILTKNGQVNIKDVVGKQVEVWNGQEWSQVKPYETGVSSLLKINLSNGLSLTCTPDHRFLVATPKRDTKELGGLKTINVEAQSLRVGDCLPKFFTESTGSDKVLEYAYESGLFCGDGSINNSRDGKYPRKELRLFGNKKKLADHIQWKSKTTWGDPEMVRGYLPDEVLDKHVVPQEYDILSKQQWLCGLIDADGCSTSSGVSISMKDKEFATQVALLVQSLGGEPFVHTCQRTEGFSGEGTYYCVSISLHSLPTVFSEAKPKRVKLPNCKNTTKVGKRHLVEVISIELLPETEMTYCFTEPLRGNGVFNGILTKQCAIAPTVTNSIICGNVSPGIEPFAANAFEKKTSRGTMFFKNPTLKKVLEEHGQDCEDTWDSIIAKTGSVQHLKFLSPEEKEVFLTAREIDQLAIIAQAAERQKSMDSFRQGQAQSINLFFSSDVDETYFTKCHWMAWKSGIKTLYYCRSQAVCTADLPPSTQQRINAVATGHETEECLACHG